MKTIKASVFFAFLLAFFALSYTQAASNVSEDTRYFVQTTKGFWKSTLGVRNTFDDGFTTDLSDWQLRLTKIAGLKVYPVKKLSILPTSGEVVVPEGKSAKPIPRPTPSEQVPWGIKILYGNPLLTKSSGGAGVVVAVLDTGVFKDHPDLKSRIHDCKDFTQSKPIVDGKCEDRNGHGTHVAGIIAADGGADGLGIYGVAPDASLFAYKVCSANGSCWSDDIAVALRTAADNGANIVNLSLGSDTLSSLIADAINYATDKGVLVVAAAGNDGPYLESIDYPAALVPVVGVGALDATSNIADWSSRGVNSTDTAYLKEEKDIEFAVPGVNIESTWKDGAYVILSGTSMAAPHIVGFAAKLWQKDAPKPAEATRELLHTLSHDILPAGDDDASGWGLPHL